MREVFVRDPAKGRTVHIGRIEGDTFYRLVDPTRHLHEKFNAYGIQEDAFPVLRAEGVKHVVLERPNDYPLRSVLDTWDAHGHLHDFGHGPQVFLSVDWMHT